MLKSLKKRASELDVHTKEVVRKSSFSSIVKASGMFLHVLLSIFLGRIIGAAGIGIIDLSNRIINLLLIFSFLGTQQVLVKETAIAYSSKNWARIANNMYTAFIVNGGFSLVISFIGIILSPYIATTLFNTPDMAIPLMIAMAVMTPQLISRIYASGLIGFKKIWQSNLVDQALSVFITGFLLLVFWLFKKDITINFVALLYGIGRVAVTIAIGTYWRTLFSYRHKKKLLAKSMLKVAMPLYLSSIAGIVFSMADGIILGWLSDAKAVGLFSVASRIALLTSFFLQVTNAAVSPKIAALFAEKKVKEMEKMVQRVTFGLGIIGLASVLVFIIAGQHILSLWGAEFAEAHLILIVLSIGYFFNIATGATGLILIMCGFEKLQSRISLCFMIINLVLNYFFIRSFGALGAAIATGLSYAGLNIVKFIFVRVKLGITTIPYFKP